MSQEKRRVSITVDPDAAPADLTPLARLLLRLMADPKATPATRSWAKSLLENDQEKEPTREPEAPAEAPEAGARPRRTRSPRRPGRT